MLSTLFAQAAESTEDGIFGPNASLADICFLIAVIVLAIAFVIRVIAKPLPLDAVLMAAGAALIAFGLLVLT